MCGRGVKTRKWKLLEEPSVSVFPCVSQGLYAPGTMLVGKGAEVKPAGVSGHRFLTMLLIRSTYMNHFPDSGPQHPLSHSMLNSDIKP